MKMKRRTWKLQAGVSLLEVLVTIMIVTGGLLVVMSSFVGIAKSNRYVEKMETANSLLRLELKRFAMFRLQTSYLQKRLWRDLQRSMGIQAQRDRRRHWKCETCHGPDSV